MSPLEALIRDQIAGDGPISVAEFMELALGHPDHGYYMTGDPFGAAGDFITAPEISQVFGELIGLWAAVTWQQMGSPKNLILIECGPGRGTLMKDMLRAAKSVPDFARAIDIHLVENSPAMRRRQEETLAGHAPCWHDDIATIPAGATILVANEFLDALPIHQFVSTDTGWVERCIGIANEELAFVTGKTASACLPALPSDAPRGAIFETCPAAMDFADRLGRRLRSAPGAALVIDYGHGEPAAGDTLQAIHRHAFADPLTDPGKADLTAHVDFDAFARRLRSAGAATSDPITQSEFLGTIGIQERTQQLLKTASPEAGANLVSATSRLTDPAEMGELFKVMVATSPEMPRLAGFESWAEETC
jgi:NADH dehydrogenase [ubiquinone] 1 alpha subcomplex assembly factor 7